MRAYFPIQTNHENISVIVQTLKVAYIHAIRMCIRLVWKFLLLFECNKRRKHISNIVFMHAMQSQFQFTSAKWIVLFYCMHAVYMYTNTRWKKKREREKGSNNDDKTAPSVFFLNSMKSKIKIKTKHPKWKGKRAANTTFHPVPLKKKKTWHCCCGWDYTRAFYKRLTYYWILVYIQWNWIHTNTLAHNIYIGAYIGHMPYNIWKIFSVNNIISVHILTTAFIYVLISL